MLYKELILLFYYHRLVYFQYLSTQFHAIMNIFKFFKKFLRYRTAFLEKLNMNRTIIKYTFSIRIFWISEPLSMNEICYV